MGTPCLDVCTGRSVSASVFHPRTWLQMVGQPEQQAVDSQGIVQAWRKRLAGQEVVSIVRQCLPYYLSGQEEVCRRLYAKAVPMSLMCQIKQIFMQVAGHHAVLVPEVVVVLALAGCSSPHIPRGDRDLPVRARPPRSHNRHPPSRPARSRYIP